MNQKQLLIAGIISLFLYAWAMDHLMEVPVVGFFLAWVGWLIPLTFFYGVWEESNKK